MTSANMDGKALHESKFLECDFSAKSISKTDFWKSFMCSSVFDYCIINECDFRNTELQYTVFENARISNTDFSNVKFENIDFDGAMFEETVLIGAEFKNIINMVDATIKSINIGTVDDPDIIFGDEAKAWIYKK